MSTIRLGRAVRILVAKWWMAVLIGGGAAAWGTVDEAGELTGLLEGASGLRVASPYPWKWDILTTVFWIGNDRTAFTPTTNFDSAWDTKWHENFGGEDDPKNRKSYRPRSFIPELNPFYVALPFNDVAFPEKAKKWVPWFTRDFVKRYQSVCKGKWVAVHCNGRFCFGTWEDVGPFRVDNAEYVFGDGPVNTPTGAGLDVSPAMRDYLNMSGRAKCDWRFVEADEVPPGPWLHYGELALVLAESKKLKEGGKRLPRGADGFKPKDFVDPTPVAPPEDPLPMP